MNILALICLSPSCFDAITTIGEKKQIFAYSIMHILSIYYDTRLVGLGLNSLFTVLLLKNKWIKTITCSFLLDFSKVLIFSTSLMVSHFNDIKTKHQNAQINAEVMFMFCLILNFDIEELKNKIKDISHSFSKQGLHCTGHTHAHTYRFSTESFWIDRRFWLGLIVRSHSRNGFCRWYNIKVNCSWAQSCRLNTTTPRL